MGVSFLHDTTLISHYFFVYLILERVMGGTERRSDGYLGCLNCISVLVPNLIASIAPIA